MTTNFDSMPRLDAPKKRGRKKPVQSTAKQEQTLHLSSTDRDIAPFVALDQPLVGQLVAEDACWRFAVDAWLAAKPPRWTLGRRRVWKAAGQVLVEKRARLRETAAELGYPLRASAK